MTSRSVPGAALAVLLLAGLGCGACTDPTDGAPSTVQSGAEPLPTDPAGLAALLLAEVPSGLPRVPDDELDPPAGEKTAADVAGYAPDAAEQRRVLDDYGYRWGWERFWRSDQALTSVFVDQFGDPAGAGSYADDLARNDAQYYGGVPDTDPVGLPPGCVLLVVDAPAPHLRMAGPAAFSWCSRGVFTLAVAAVASSPQAARTELDMVTAQQLERLPT
jgi:hypothetical protein